MSPIEILAKFFDTYERKARLYPALLTGAPLMAVAIGIYGAKFEIDESLVAGLASIGLIYLLATISREMGKRLEDRLFASWGGKPTTQILRYANALLDPVTKARYHSFLSKKLETRFPTPTDETGNPVGADAVYASGARWLLDQTRDRAAFPLLFKELISYGFRRNCLGLKPIALTTALFALGWTLVATDVVTSAGFSSVALISLSMPAKVVLAVNLAFLAIWMLFITQLTVKTSAFMYAELLLRACDQLDKKS